MKNRLIAILLILSMMIGGVSVTASAKNDAIKPWDYVEILGKGMDVDWSKTKQGREYYNKTAVVNFKKAGVSHVRIRVADAADEELLKGLEQQVDDCLEVGIIPIIAYQADEFKNEPSEENIQEVVNWWSTVAEHFKDKSHKLSFDLLIEATDALNKQPEKLNEIFERLVTEIRKTNPTRIIMISPQLRSDPEYLKNLKIPTQHNGYLMAEWHFYASGPSKTNERKLWTTGSAAEKKIIIDKIETALAWQKSSGVPTWVGAWMPGNYNDGNDYSIKEQVVFASFVTSELTKAKIPFAVNSDTKFYDRRTDKWIVDIAPVMEVIYGDSSKNSMPSINELAKKGILVGFNAKGNLNVKQQCTYLRQELANLKKQGVDTSKIRIRLQGGSISQKTYPSDWSDAAIKEWAKIQKDYGCQFAFVVNFNDTAKSQLSFYNRLKKVGMKFSFIELGNEQYLPKFALSKVDEYDEVTKRTANMTTKKYISMCNEYMKEFKATKLPFYVQFAPENKDNTSYDAWNKAIAKAIDNKEFASKNVHGTVHLYERGGDGSLNAKQIQSLRKLVKTKIKIAVTEYGVVDKKGKLTTKERIAQEKNLTTRILSVMQKGDLLLNQVLYTDYKDDEAAILHPKYKGITPKGKEIMNIYKKFWI